jgi:hypothetical protein
VSAQRVYEGIQVVRGREGIDDGDTQGTDIFHCGLHEIELARLNETATQIELKLSKLFGGRIMQGSRAIAEGDTITLRFM